MEITINVTTYLIYVNGKCRYKTTSLKKANEKYDIYYYDMFEHNYVELINEETGEILKGGAR